MKSDDVGGRGGELNPMVCTCFLKRIAMKEGFWSEEEHCGMVKLGLEYLLKYLVFVKGLFL